MQRPQLPVGLGHLIHPRLLPAIPWQRHRYLCVS